MSLAVATLSATTAMRDTDNTQRRQMLTGTVAIGASPLTYAAGGLVIAYAAGVQEKLKCVPGDTPVYMVAQTIAAYAFVYNITTGKLMVYDFSTDAELAVAAIPAALSGATIYFNAEYLRE